MSTLCYSLHMYNVIQIVKKRDRRDPKIYRGISIFNTWCKIYSNILNKKLYNYSEQLITETQNGFWKGRSCTDATLSLKLLIKNEENTIWKHTRCWQILYDILKPRNIPYTILKATVDIHTQNKVSMKFNSKLSKFAEISKGVCQGCPLLPTLFNI
jgi:hypothetical protein